MNNKDGEGGIGTVLLENNEEKRGLERRKKHRNNTFKRNIYDRFKAKPLKVVEKST